jgi:hypothetical protein
MRMPQLRDAVLSRVMPSTLRDIDKHLRRVKKELFKSLQGFEHRTNLQQSASSLHCKLSAFRDPTLFACVPFDDTQHKIAF